MNHSLQIFALLTGAALMAAPAFAQTAPGDLTSPPSSAEVPASPASPPAAAPELEMGPSRYAGDAVQSYVRQLTSSLLMANRPVDPFGKHQDPDFVAPQPTLLPSGPGQKPKAEPPVPFADIIAGIQVNTVIPAQQKFLIGNREFSTGSEFPLLLPTGKQVQVRVLSVSSQRIRFLNLADQESADLQLNMLPEGMRRGIGNLNAPGVEPDNATAPVEIQPVTPFSSNSP